MSASRWPWRSGLRLDATGDDLLVLDPDRGRLVRLTGPAAAVVAGPAPSGGRVGPPGPDADVRARVAAHLRGLGLLDAVGDGASVLAPDRRRVLAAGGAAALGIAVLTLPGAARASSTVQATLVDGKDQLDLALARATVPTGGGVAHVAGAHVTDELGAGAVAMRTVHLDDGSVGPLQPLRPFSAPEAIIIARDIVRVGNRAYVLYIAYADGLGFLDGPVFAPEVVVGSGVIEVDLAAEGETGMAVLRTLTNADIRDELWGGYMAIATDGTDVLIAGVAEVPTVDGPWYEAVIERLLIPTLLTDPLGIAARVIASQLGGDADVVEVPLAMVVSGSDLYVQLQQHSELDMDNRPLLTPTLSALLRIALDDTPTLGTLTGVREIGESSPLPAIYAGRWIQPIPLVFEGNLYAVDQGLTEVTTEVGTLTVAVSRLHRFALGPSWDLPDEEVPEPGVWPALSDQVLELTLPEQYSTVSLDSASMALIGSTLVVSGLGWVHRVGITTEGVLAELQFIDLVEEVTAIGQERYPAGETFDFIRVLGLSPILPATSGARAFFGFGKGKEGLLEVTL